ncbi:MAG: RdgB/HAM1 family non-canonical purine NTP pyrophosphatase [Bacilli bacterium]|nr:RdgB/HAM1 family non-canonical purine NTP pyrophosphatase [Bacilli bacterium]
MIYTELTRLAMEIAEEAHHGVTDKGGFPYINHPLHLAEGMADQYSCATALLHDVVEDTPLTIEDLRRKGIEETVLEAVDLLTHKEGVPYMDYVKLIGTNRIARMVKLADLAHNLDSSRILNGKGNKKKDTYLKAKAYLESLETPYDTFVLATTNKGKIKEYEDLLAPLNPRILLPSDIGFREEIEENGTTYSENAIIKAMAIAEHTPIPVIADDSGIEIDAMGGGPGLHTARYAKQMGGYPDVWYKVIEETKGKSKGARFVCHIAYKEKGKDVKVFEGICPGYILDAPSGTNGFGYDPIFHSEEGNVDFGLSSDEEKAKYSHRGKACKKLLEFILEEREKSAKAG